MGLAQTLRQRSQVTVDALGFLQVLCGENTMSSVPKMLLLQNSRIVMDLSSVLEAIRGRTNVSFSPPPSLPSEIGFFSCLGAKGNVFCGLILAIGRFFYNNRWL